MCTPALLAEGGAPLQGGLGCSPTRPGKIRAPWDCSPPPTSPGSRCGRAPCIVVAPSPTAWAFVSSRVYNFAKCLFCEVALDVFTPFVGIFRMCS